MDRILYWLALAVVRTLQALPLRAVARIGRGGGALAFLLDKRHRRVALRNLAKCFPEKSSAEVHRIARENFRRIGENFACAIRTSSSSRQEIDSILEVGGVEKLRFPQPGLPAESRIVAVGHFGNFELFPHCFLSASGYHFATTFRAFKPPSINRLFQDLRKESGCHFFERRTEGDALKEALNRGGLLLGLFSDQHAGDRGLKLPFFGEDCSTSAAPAVLALRYGCPLFTAMCYRKELAKWRVEVGDEIPTHRDGKARPVAEIMLDVNKAFETAVRRDPANWFWVHNRWKPGKARRGSGAREVAEGGPNPVSAL